MALLEHFPDWISLSPKERAGAAEGCRERLARIGRSLNAVATIVEAPCEAGGALGGLPYVAKDMIATGISAPSWGCRIPLSFIPKPALIIQQLSAAGACLIGAAEMTELAYEPSGVNVARGHVRNPWNFDHVPGGSSSGSAALVAAGCAFAALGSDTGGSVRIPAHCCGITALKPSWGAIAVEGTMPLAPSLDTIGLMARSAADLSLIWSALSGPVAPVTTEGITAVVLEDAFVASDPEIARICRAAVSKLADLGIDLQERTGFPQEADERALLVLQAEAARSHREHLEDERLDPMLSKRLRKGLTIGDDALATALAEREPLRTAFLSDLLGTARLAITPVMPIPTPRVAEVDPASPAFNPRTLYALSRFTRFVNYLGLPALALPAGFDQRGMPVNLQIIGHPGSEALLLAVGAALQNETDWHGRMPTAIRDVMIEEGIRA